MIKQCYDRRGHLRHFAIRTIRPVVIREDRVIELNPITGDVIHENLAVQIKPTETIKKVNGLLGSIVDELAGLIAMGGRL
jgi:hypothetical protein